MSDTLYEDDELMVIQFTGPDRGDGSDRRRIQITTDYEQMTFTVKQWTSVVKAVKEVKIRGKEKEAKDRNAPST